MAQNRKHNNQTAKQREAQTARQREAHRRAQAAREEAARAAAAARRAKQIRYGVIAGLLTLALIGTLVWYGLRNHGPETPVDTASPEVTQPTTENVPGVPDPALAEGRTWTAVLQTSQGDITIELDGAAAPQAVANFIYLARDGFFNDTFCHRLTTWGVLQCGDPTGTGGGGPGWNFGPIENAPADDFYPTGTVAMARVGGQANSMGSQFFLVFEGTPIPSDAAGGYTVFGRITSGLDIVQAVAAAGVAGGGSDGRPATDVTIEGVTVQ